MVVAYGSYILTLGSPDRFEDVQLHHKYHGCDDHGGQRRLRNVEEVWSKVLENKQKTN